MPWGLEPLMLSEDSKKHEFIHQLHIHLSQEEDIAVFAGKGVKARQCCKRCVCNPASVGFCDKQ